MTAGAETPESRWTKARRRRHRQGRWSEWVAAALLAAKGYRILARRQRTGLGEIDLIVVRGHRLAFVEVKRRQTQADAEASITARQRLRVRRAAGLWLARHPAYQAHDIGFDLVFIVAGTWPRHLPDAL